MKDRYGVSCGFGKLFFFNNDFSEYVRKIC